MAEILVYELIDISFSFGYDSEREDSPHWLVHDDSKIFSDEQKDAIQYDADGIPMGQSMEEIKMREELIRNFFEKWKSEHPEQKVHNKSLDEDILVRAVSVIEAREHSSKSYRSTLAVIHLDNVLAEAKKAGETKAKQTDKNQRNFDKVLVMEYQSEIFGRAKLTVGVRHRTKEKIQYGLTSVPLGKDLIDPKLALGNTKKKKAPHKK